MTTYLNDQPSPRILSVGTSHPPSGYSQQDVLDLFQVTDAKIGSMFRNSHIEQRYLYLPQPNAGGGMPDESSLELWKKHRQGALRLGAEAISRALKPIGASVEDIDYLVCVTSTGFLCPSLTAHFIKELGFRSDVHRVDVVGMGCNAGLNALQPMANYCALNQDKLGLQLCVEVCSAAYVFDGTIGSAVVNCLFGDGAAAVVVGAKRGGDRLGPRLLGFQSHIIPQAIEAMRFEYDGNKNAFHPFKRDIPYVIGENVAIPVAALLARCGIKRRDIAHWVVHSGGRKVIDSIKYSMGLSDHDVRHTQSVLNDYGNLSSGSFLFSLDRLMHDEQVTSGEYVVLMTMGPGSTIECSLGRF